MPFPVGVPGGGIDALTGYVRRHGPADDPGSQIIIGRHKIDKLHHHDHKAPLQY
jgi:hypothetical protein